MRSPKLWIITMLAVYGCSQDVGTGRRCASDDDRCTSGLAARGAAGHAGSQTIDNPAGSGSSVPGAQPALTVHLEDVEKMTIDVVTLACAGDCVLVEAVARGGRPPYAFAWDDGTTTAARELCSDRGGVFSVTVEDTPLEDAEFSYEGQTASARVMVDVLDCRDPSDAGLPSEGCERAEDLGEIMPDIFGAPTYFAAGAPLGAGRYRIAYVDGCLRYEGPWAWSVNGLEIYQYVVIGESTTEVLAVAPGMPASGIFGAAFDYPDFEDCVAASLASPALELEFAGGRLGLWQNDFKPDDNVPGIDGRNPTWRLTRCE